MKLPVETPVWADWFRQQSYFSVTWQMRKVNFLSNVREMDKPAIHLVKKKQLNRRRRDGEAAGPGLTEPAGRPPGAIRIRKAPRPRSAHVGQESSLPSRTSSSRRPFAVGSPAGFCPVTPSAAWRID
jgi:hypothetical protein